MTNRKQLTNYEENHCLRHTNYEIRILYPVIRSTQPIPAAGVDGDLSPPNTRGLTENN
jgi:hypothetical protein